MNGDARQDSTGIGFNTREIAIGEIKPGSVARFDCNRWFGRVRHQTRDAAGAGHGVPLITHAAGVKEEGSRARWSETAIRCREGTPEE